MKKTISNFKLFSQQLAYYNTHGLNTCPLPNVHVFVQPNGVKPCCAYMGISKSTIEEFWHSSILASINPALSASNPVLGCKSCALQEKTTGISTRLAAQSDWADIPRADNPIFLDLRISNLCNYRCRSCEPDFSSRIAHDARKNPQLQKFYFSNTQHKIQTMDTQDIDYVLKILPDLRVLKFAGGEPTLIPEVRRILEHVATSDFDIDIQITTNGSFHDDFWHDIIQRLPRIHWTLSLDGVGAHAELIRAGTNWPLVEKNLHFLAKHSSSILVNTTVSNLNIMQLAPLIRLINQTRLENQTQRNGLDHLFYPAVHPSHLVPWNLPSALRKQAQQRIQDYLCLGLTVDNDNFFARLSSNMDEISFDSRLWHRSQEFNSALDNIHSENYQICFE